MNAVDARYLRRKVEEILVSAAKGIYLGFSLSIAIVLGATAIWVLYLLYQKIKLMLSIFAREAVLW